ncbi:hypothetical protein RDWZM_010518 [Blomia tropicalis]|uniref:Sugar transporter SWEET1 n=1 Tax=Blomia tropicalis TaxID=40697 RepID=A0A9Q0LWW8_BLOTA|nr:hypothetical protein RDWZM_010518 [Blomia tropicalis]
MELIDVIGILATFVTIGSFLTGILICRNIYRRRSSDEFDSFPFVAGVLSTYIWTRYGFILNDHTMIFINSIGFVLQLSYLSWYFIYTPSKSRLKGRIWTLVAIITMVNFYMFFSSDSSDVIGTMASIASLIFCASPLASVTTVLRTKSTKTLPFPMIFASFIVSSLWFTYGYLIDNIFVQVPNAISTGIGLIQLSLFVFYPSNGGADMKKFKNKDF